MPPLDEDGPDKPSAVAHLVDIVTFRAMGTALIAYEVSGKNNADWQVLAAGFAMFFMPDALRGRSGIVWMALGRFFKLDQRENER